ncbi:hypothetical protein A2U01_0092380, partial [Trifolium medium]|nr:hypothetical protein [Trifolium medium]
AAEEKTSGNTSASGAGVPEAKSTEDNTTTETVATGTTGASEANTIDKGKKPAASAFVDNPVFEKPEGK